MYLAKNVPYLAGRGSKPGLNCGQLPEGGFAAIFSGIYGNLEPKKYNLKCFMK